MLPWGHLAVGYLLYAAFVRYRGGERPTGAAVLALVVGTQFPDLVDKPLGWYLGVLPGGRSMAHSILVAAVLLAVVHRVAPGYDRRESSVAFAIGYVSHLAADALYPVLYREWVDLVFLLWPVVDDETLVTDATITEVLFADVFSLTWYFEAALFVAAVSLWAYDGAPGLAELNEGVARVASRLSPR